MAFRIGLFVFFITSLPSMLLAQCDDDDDDLPSGSISASGGGGCGSAVFSLSFSLSSNDDDDDDDDVFNVSYRIGGQNFSLSGVKDGHSVEHTLTTTSTVVLVSVTYAGCTISINSSETLEVSAGPSLSITPTAPSCSGSNGTLVAGGGEIT
ncbi:MAG: hypothetical protein IPO07_04750 [Haliscomenobacter sp.]|nr:hypothetical protein [Haliscomenobacter sp.]MBK9488172.1 hypothetical protein [Haliscomenobacter sp.]